MGWVGDCPPRRDGQGTLDDLMVADRLFVFVSRETRWAHEGVRQTRGGVCHVGEVKGK